MGIIKRRSPLVLTPLNGIPMVKPGDDLTDIILKAVLDTGISLLNKDIIVITQKIATMYGSNGSLPWAGIRI